MVGFQRRNDAKRFRAALEERLEVFKLKLNGDKTRLIEFGRFAADNRAKRGLGKPESFTFLGFMHVCGHDRCGRFQVKRLSCRKRRRAKLQEVKAELRRRMHQPTAQTGKWLARVVKGYFAYHAVPGNVAALAAFRYHVMNLWRRTLRRRSQKDAMTWKEIARLADCWLPKPRVLHPWPLHRFAARHPRQEPYAGIPLVRICAGGAG
ncbi:MAG: maturase [Hyphomicrobiales bacterium]|nr:maturase [Hyphomicrobiales bacterium]